jgi:hypothetical protein
MLRKLFVMLIVLLALVLAILGMVLPKDQLQWVISVANFFDIMIPILAVGALVNYLWKSCSYAGRSEE